MLKRNQAKPVRRKRATPQPPVLPPAKTTFWATEYCFQPGMLCRSFVHKNYSLGMHAHGFIELNLVLRGTGWHVLPQAALPIRRGDVFVIPPGMNHGYRCDRDLDVRHLLIHPDWIARNLQQLQLLPGYLSLFTIEPMLRADEGMRHALRVKGERFALLVGLLRRLEEESGHLRHSPQPAPDRPTASRSSNGLSADMLTDALLRECIILCSRWHLDATDETPADTLAGSGRIQALQNVLRLMNDAYGGKLTLKQLAQAAHLQHTHFCRIFRQMTGMTPMAYLEQIRIGQACRILDAGGSVTDAGACCGFFDTSHFSRTFKQAMGLTPKAYKKRR